MTRVILATSRLSLRALTREDLEFVFSLRSDSRVMRFFPKRLNQEECLQWIERMLNNYTTQGFGHWLAWDRQTGEPRGTVGMLRQQVPDRELIEVGYMFHPEFWGQGLASEAASACRDWAFQQLKVDRVHSLIRPENIPSQRVAARMGMVAEPDTVPFHGLEHRVFGIGRQDWEKLPGLAIATGENLLSPSEQIHSNRAGEIG